MIYNGKEIPKELFILGKSDLNPGGLWGYAKKIREHFEIKIVFAEKPDGTQYETAEYFPDDKLILIPSRFVYEGLSENDYLAAKGAIDHEIGHVLCVDESYLYKNNKDDEDKELIYDFGNIIDDIRNEQRMTEKFGVDKNNFKILSENIRNYLEPNNFRNVFLDIEMLFSLAVCITYRDSDIKYYKKENVNQWDLFQNKLKPIIDNFLQSDGDAKDTAKEIINLLRSNHKYNIKVLEKYSDKIFIIEIVDKLAELSFCDDAPDYMKEGDKFPFEILMAQLALIEKIVIFTQEDNEE